MMIDFEVFADACDIRGYVPVKQDANLFYVKTKNGVKHEVKFIKRHGLVFVMGYGRCEDDIIALKENLTEVGYEIVNDSMKAIFVPFTNMDDFFDLASMIENIDGIVAKSRGRAYSSINRKGLFANIATVMKTMFDTGMFGMMNRGVFDAVDDIIALNEKTPSNNYREHIVPCVMIIDEAFRMFDEDDASVAEVAAMIQQNLFVVHIPGSEATRLDAVYKTTMPEGWKFGDSVFARLDAMGIEY